MAKGAKDGEDREGQEDGTWNSSTALGLLQRKPCHFLPFHR